MGIEIGAMRMARLERDLEREGFFKDNVVVNPSGILPTEYKVLVRPIEVENKIGSIFIPDQHKEKQEFAQQEGMLVAVSPVAFNYEKFPDGSAPKPGDRVLYAKYAGFLRVGNDGVSYRVINDRDICAVLV